MPARSGSNAIFGTITPWLSAWMPPVHRVNNGQSHAWVPYDQPWTGKSSAYEIGQQASPQEYHGTDPPDRRGLLVPAPAWKTHHARIYPRSPRAIDPGLA